MRRICFHNSCNGSFTQKRKEDEMIYFSCHESLFHTKRATLMFGGVKTLFKELVVSSVTFQHKDIVDRFDVLADARIFVLLPKKWDVDENQKWELKVWQKLKKPIYIITPENTVILARFVEGNLDTVKMLEDEKEVKDELTN